MQQSNIIPDVFRYQIDFFQSKAIQLAIQRQGFAIVDFLNPGEINHLLKGFDDLSNAVQADFGPYFWPSGRHPDPAVRNLAKSHIDAVIPPALKPILKENAVDLIGGTYLIKPPGPATALNPHQDSSHTDESRFFSVYAWIPLHDTTVENGAIHVLPFSHHWPIRQRSLNVPWLLEPHVEIIRPFMVPLPMKAGQLLLFDAALVHSSPPNFSDQTRVAVNFYLHPKGQPFTHFYRDESMQEGEVELFSVTTEFYYSEDFESRPGSKYPSLGIQHQPLTKIPNELLMKWLESDRQQSIQTELFPIK
jgi:hypothetical protein